MSVPDNNFQVSPIYLKQCFPSANIENIKDIFYFRGNCDDYAFIVVHENFNDIRTYHTPGFSEEALENKLFSIIGRYTTKPLIIDSIDIDPPAEKIGSNSEEEIREDMVRLLTPIDKFTIIQTICVFTFLLLQLIAVMILFKMGLTWDTFPRAATISVFIIIGFINLIVILSLKKVK